MSMTPLGLPVVPEVYTTVIVHLIVFAINWMIESFHGSGKTDIEVR